MFVRVFVRVFVRIQVVTNDIHNTLQALLAHMEALEACSAASPVTLDGSPADIDDIMLPTNHIVKRPIASDLTPFPKLIKYQAPVLNYSGMRTHTKRTDAQLAEIQFCLSGLTHSIDLFVHDVLVEGSIQVTQALGFVNTMHELLSDLASVVTQMRSDNICLDVNLPITLIVTNSALEPKPLLDSQRIVEQTKLQHALHDAT
ncbi:hypothetical protein PHYBLDRAFT_63606 [Phycomyces blakesleeanus NRRL 1555(-)]|uniref:Uncharacterized protein n=1 Tax=Phycomyces blakesleeanus (strain ATCC 8743b / DSM 1359 / FGSC 10004 / NBRC 33097 / NRRL 1555) TaxID=763407 RepID=A0A162ZKB0_PHYB8|nr:hypothetical protein PHYBLDRAFT_63606 [Phycomyces blakesleeanus NRRL 1555(-)]OAD67391.1 hypothetical protein PHYBLDRAFT_63606 [Phycomyces blakesleeanus NRRL 1555(-)]|eukprot:XP_018285431.1 hypothetical protein PHYBLDRAFT_63606 [Phycomyces blakesleeanus NRRL 1555(-)]